MNRFGAKLREKDAGYILVFVLGMLLTIGLILGDISRRTHLGGSVLLNSVSQIERRAMSDGAIEIGKAILAKTLETGGVGAPLVDFETELEGFQVSVEVRDECGKINLNSTDSNTLGRLLETLGVEASEARDIAASVIVFRNAEKRNGSRFDSIEALLVLKEVTPALIFALRDLATVYCPRKTLSVWTAPPQVLASLQGAVPSEMDKFLEDRSSRQEGDQNRRVNLMPLSKKPGKMSALLGPVYTVKSSLVGADGIKFTREQLVFVGGRGMSEPMILQSSFRRNQEGLN